MQHQLTPLASQFQALTLLSCRGLKRTYYCPAKMILKMYDKAPVILLVSLGRLMSRGATLMDGLQ